MNIQEQHKFQSENQHYLAISFKNV